MASECSRCKNPDNTHENRCHSISKYWADGRDNPDPTGHESYFGWKLRDCEYSPEGDYASKCRNDAMTNITVCGAGPAFDKNCDEISGMGGSCGWSGQGKIACGKAREWFDYLDEGKIMECCFDQRNDYGCSPGWCQANTNVEGTDAFNRVKAHCTQPGNWVGKSKCREWCLRFPHECRSMISTHCSAGSNLSSSACQEWCRDTRTTPGLESACDGASVAYCNRYPNDSKCKCQKPPAKATALQELMSYPMECWYQPCKEIGTNNIFITSSQEDNLKNSCPNTVCILHDNEINVTGDGNIVDLKNECQTLLNPGVEIGGSPPSGSPPSGSPPPASPPSEAPDEGGEEDQKKKILLGLMMVLAFIVILLLASTLRQ